MDLIKNTSFITSLFIIFAILVTVLGLYREYLYREEDRRHREKMIEKLNALESKLNKSVEAGEMSKETAQKIRNIFLSDTISINDEVKTKLSPSNKTSLKDKTNKERPIIDNKTTLKDELQIEVIRGKEKDDDKSTKNGK